MSDYISRQEAIMIMKEFALPEPKSEMARYIHEAAEVTVNTVVQILTTMPSAQKTGHWVKAQRRGITEYCDGFCECDQCHEVSWLGWSDKYCRNCGSQMEVEHEQGRSD